MYGLMLWFFVNFLLYSSAVTVTPVEYKHSIDSLVEKHHTYLWVAHAVMFVSTELFGVLILITSLIKKEL